MGSEALAVKVAVIAEQLKRNDLEIEVTWFLATDNPSSATTRRGIPLSVDEEEEEGKSITVSYLSGNYKLPNPKVKYTRIEIVQSEPAMPDRLEQAVDNTESTPNDQDDFKIRDVRTWNKYLMTNSEFGVDFLIIRVQTALALPSPLPNNLGPMWEVLLMLGVADCFLRALFTVSFHKGT